MEFDIFEEARVEAPNPYTGMVLWNKLDFYPKGFTEQDLDKTYYGLVRDPDDYALMMESAPFEEVDGYYNPGTEEVDAAFITEAVVVKKFSRLEGVVRRGIVKAMNKYMTAKDPDTGTPITAMDPIVGEPRKSGLFAYVTVQIPFSDGQVVSIVFHAPEGDQKKISPDDTVVAFRWLLNKRDITNAVAPEDGKEISLETVSKRVGQLVEKNTKRFAATQKEAQAEKKELADAQENIKGLQGQTDSLMVQIADSTKELETITAQIGTTAAALEKQKTINAELRAKLEALRKAQRPAPTDTGATGGGSTTQPNTLDPSQAVKVFSDEELAQKGERLRSKIVAEVPANAIHKTEDKTAIQAAREWIEKNAAGTVHTEIGDVVVDANAITDSLSHSMYQNKLDAVQAIVPVLQNGEYLGSLPDKDGKSINNNYFAAKVKIGGIEKVVFVRTRQATGRDNRFYVHEVYTLDEIENRKDFEQGTRIQTAATHNPSDFYKKIVANVLNVKSQEPEFVQGLNDILAGKYDNDSRRIIDMLEKALDEAEKPGNEQYMDLVDKASNYYTEILSKEAM